MTTTPSTDTLKITIEQMLRDRIAELKANEDLSDYERLHGAEWHLALLSLVAPPEDAGYTPGDMTRRRLVAETAIEADKANTAAGNTIGFTRDPEIFEAYRAANLAVLAEADRPASPEPVTFADALNDLLDGAGIPESSPLPEITDAQREAAAADYERQMAEVVSLGRIFARPNTDVDGQVVEGQYAILHNEDGEPVTRLSCVPPVWPLESELSSAYEHPRGLILSAADVARLGIQIEG